MLFTAKEHKIVVVGPRKVGKSALVVRFLTKRFICEYVENTDMPCQRETMVDGEPLKVHIQDTSDKGMTLASVEHYLRWADAMMMIYSITDADGFNQLKNTATKIIEKTADLKEKEQKCIPPLVLVGNKGDLQFARKVSPQEGLELAEKLRCEFFEASAREGWSKHFTSLRLSSGSLSPSCDSDNSNSRTSSPALSSNRPRSSMCRSPTSPQLRQSPNLCDIGENNVVLSDKTRLSRWSTLAKPKETRRQERSLSLDAPKPEIKINLIPQINVSKTFTRLNSCPPSPVFSEEETDDLKQSNFLSPCKGRKHSGGTILERLSPRLRRRSSKTKKSNENQLKKNGRDDCNNNKKSRKISKDRLLFIPSPTVSENEIDMSEQNHPSTSTSGSSSCRSRSGSASSSGSDESFGFSLSETDLPTQSPPRSPDLYGNFSSEQDLSSSEPFLFLCRFRSLQRSRSRSRSPSHRLISGLKKIRSFGSDIQGQGLGKQQATTSLLVPAYKL